MPEVDETADSLEGNARLKAMAIATAAGLPTLADDTGLEVDFLGRAPGVHTARYAGVDATYADNVTLLLESLKGIPPEQRTARFITVAMVCWPDGREVVAEGIVRGHIALEPLGDRGFGYDPVFIPDEGDGRTFAEMSDRGEARAVASRAGAPGARRRARLTYALIYQPRRSIAHVSITSSPLTMCTRSCNAIVGSTCAGSTLT